MNRRSLLRLLGLAPIAAPAAVAAASRPALPPIDYADLAASVCPRVEADSKLSKRIDAVLSFDGQTLTMPSLAVGRTA